MGWFDFFKRRVPDDPQTPADVWAALQQAFERGELKRVSALLEVHEQTVRQHFDAWRQVPSAIRHNRPKVELYTQTLVAIAEAFQRAGIPDLMELLVGNESNNALLTWDSDLQQAHMMIDQGSYDTAITLLHARLNRHARHTGSGMDFYLPRTYGMLGIAYHHAGRPKLAIEYTTKALDICLQTNDQVGITTYQTNLQQML